jgi:hypothetical protein
MFQIHLMNIQKQQMEQAMLLKLFIVKNMIVIYNLIFGIQQAKKNLDQLVNFFIEMLL